MHIKGAPFHGIWILNLMPASWLTQYNQVNYMSLPPDENTSSITNLQMERDITQFVPQCDTADIYITFACKMSHS
jgi:hypothetical protein